MIIFVILAKRPYESEENIMAYVKELGGYIADVPNIHFKRCDGKVFYWDEITAASFTPNSDNIEITGGWSRYPLAFIPSSNSLEAQFTSAQFTMAIFEMANAASVEQDTAYKRWHTVLADVATNKATIPDATADLTTIQINGLELVSGTPATGQFAAAVESENVALTFFAGDIADGTTIKVSYQTTETASVVNVLTDSTSARGELTMEWPVYSNGTDCTEASTKGYVVLTVYRARVTALPGFDSSYKTAATNSITVSALDPKRPDKKMYSVAWIENT